jgi:3-methyl-2-oxobutanoate hydroxymethyltransferase
MGHIGLMPQHVQQLGGYEVQGRSPAQEATLKANALALQEAGVFSLVLEGIIEPLAREITQMLAIPTIGIGASAACDGQVLVTEDMLGLTPRTPKFVKVYAELGEQIRAAVADYAQEVTSHQFPSEAHLYR